MRNFKFFSRRRPSRDNFPSNESSVRFVSFVNTNSVTDLPMRVRRFVRVEIPALSGNSLSETECNPFFGPKSFKLFKFVSRINDGQPSITTNDSRCVKVANSELNNACHYFKFFHGSSERTGGEIVIGGERRVRFVRLSKRLSVSRRRSDRLDSPRLKFGRDRSVFHLQEDKNRTYDDIRRYTLMRWDSLAAKSTSR